MTLIKALDMVQYCIPDAIILDLELHEGGGNGLFFLSKLHDLGLENAAIHSYHHTKYK